MTCISLCTWEDRRIVAGIISDFCGWEELPTLHRLWDSHLIDHYHKSSAEWVKELSDLQPEIMNEIQQQPLEQWVHESQDLAKIIYKNTPPNSSLGDDYHHRYLSLVKIQLQKGGLRLAAHLNKIFK